MQSLDIQLVTTVIITIFYSPMGLSHCKKHGMWDSQGCGCRHENPIHDHKTAEIVGISVIGKFRTLLCLVMELPIGTQWNSHLENEEKRKMYPQKYFYFHAFKIFCNNSPLTACEIWIRFSPILQDVETEAQRGKVTCSVTQLLGLRRLSEDVGQE